MPALNEYVDLDRPLHSVVFPGSHDAGITSGGANAITQNLDIQQQAEAGVRLFDLRIATVNTGVDAQDRKTAEMKAIHLDGKLQGKRETQRVVNGKMQDVTRTKRRFNSGAVGLGLDAILEGAAKFVRRNENEFLILKFSKSTNIQKIADRCEQRLEGSLLLGTFGNLNTKSVGDLGGKVIPVFEDLSVVNSQRGIFGIKNHYKKTDAQFEETFCGIEYLGKGGTAINNKGFEAKIAENQTKQTKIMENAAGGYTKTRRFRSDLTYRAKDSRVLGMMYWTTTGVNKSIRDRDDLMWTGVDNDDRATNPTPVLNALKTTWAAGVRESVGANVNAEVHEMMEFMPNVIMIDFADTHRCETIYELNHTTVNDLRGMAATG